MNVVHAKDLQSVKYQDLVDSGLKPIQARKLKAIGMRSGQRISTPAVQRSACATGADMGRYLTEVKAAAYLTRPVPMRGRPGVFDVDVPEDSLPPPAALPPRRWTIGDGDDSG